MIEASGRLARVKLDGDNLTITRLGTFGGVKSKLTIKTGAIASIDYKAPGAFSAGYIEVHAGQIGDNFSQPMFKQDRRSCAMFVAGEEDTFNLIAIALGVADVAQPEEAVPAAPVDDISHGVAPDKMMVMKQLAWIGGIGLVVFAIIAGEADEEEKPDILANFPTSTANATREVEPTQAKPQSGEHCLSGWDGANRDLVRQVKATMRDPDSFEHIDTRIYGNDKGEHGLWMTFRARNGFGGMNVEKIYARIDHESCNALRFGEGAGI